MRSVPFEIETSGLTQTTGVLRVEEEHLAFEMQSTVLGFFRRAPKTFAIDLTDLDEIGHKRGLRHDRLTIRTRPLDRITALPGAADGTLCLRVKRAHRASVDALLDRLYLWRPTET